MPTDTELLKDTKLLFALRTSQNVTLTILAKPGPDAPGPQAPDLWILSEAKDDYLSFAYDRGGCCWTAPLLPGDHIVRMDAPGESWFDGEVTFTLSEASTIVALNATRSLQPDAWAASGGTVNNNPKDPTPPKAAPGQALSNAEWLYDTLQSLHSRFASRRDVIGDHRPQLRSATPSSVP